MWWIVGIIIWVLIAVIFMWRVEISQKNFLVDGLEKELKLVNEDLYFKKCECLDEKKESRYRLRRLALIDHVLKTEHRIYALKGVGGYKPLEECFIYNFHNKNELEFWYNDKNNSSHVIRERDLLC